VSVRGTDDLFISSDATTDFLGIAHPINIKNVIEVKEIVVHLNEQYKYLLKTTEEALIIDSKAIDLEPEIT
jgi:hypothetical protein